MAVHNFKPVFSRLRDMLKRHAGSLVVKSDRADYYGLEAAIGPATLRAWGGKTKSRTMAVAWVKVGKSYVSYHLMGIYAYPKFLDGCSHDLLARMQGKSCFNFKVVDERLFEELEKLTVKSLEGMKKTGFTS